MTADEAWTLFCRKGVTPVGHADTIAERRRLQREWAEEGQRLR